MNNHPEISRELLEKIESYLLNRMDEEERIVFENQMTLDTELYYEVQLQKELIDAIQLGALRESLEEIKYQENKRDEESIDTQPNRYWYAMAASVLALVAITVWMFNKTDPQEKIFAEYVEYDPGLPIPMSTSANYNFFDAMVDYKNEMYEKAISKWRVLLLDDPENDTLNYYIGSAHFVLQDYEQAIPYFIKVAALESPEFHAKSEWYLVLSWIRTGQFRKIDSVAAISRHPYSDKIHKINQQLIEQ